MRLFLAAALSLMMAGAVRAETILFAGGEVLDFTFAQTSVTTAGKFRTAYARSAIPCVNCGAGTPRAPGNSWYTTFTASSEFWIHGQFHNEINLTSPSYHLLSGCITTGTDCRIGVRGTGTNGQIEIYKVNSAGTLTSLATSAASALPSDAAPHAFDLHVKYSTSGSVTLYVDGVSIASYTGDVTVDSLTTLGAAIGGQVTGNTAYWSEIIISDSSTIGFALQALVPQAAGNAQQWTPNTIGHITEINDSTATYLDSSTIDQLSQWTLPAIAAGTWRIAAIAQSFIGAQATSAPQSISWSVRIGTTDYEATSTAMAPSTWLARSKIWNTSPAGGAWTAFPVNLGLKSKT